MTVLSTSVASPSVRRRTSLPVASADFAHEARHALEHRLHRLGADRHDAVLDLARQLLQLVEARRDAGVAHGEPACVDALRQHRLVDDQFADEVDQAVDAVEIDADGAGVGAAPPPVLFAAVCGVLAGRDRSTADQRRAVGSGRLGGGELGLPDPVPAHPRSESTMGSLFTLASSAAMSKLAGG